MGPTVEKGHDVKTEQSIVPELYVKQAKASKAEAIEVQNLLIPAIE